jgi:hypothetical protein
VTQMLTFRAPGQEPFDVELDDATWAWIEAVCARRGVTLDQLFEDAIESFLASHPIIAQTRRPQ